MIDSILIKNVEIVTGAEIRTGDVFIENGKIKAIEPFLQRPAALIIQESGLTLMPGVIDTHVHFRDPGLTAKEDLESGSRAAASGGVTSFFDMPNTIPAATTRQAIADKKALAAQKSLINYNFFIGATPENLDELLKTENVPGIKVFMGSSTGSLLVNKAEDLDRLFAHTNKLIAVHAEDEDLIAAQKKKYEGTTDPSDHQRIRNPEAAIKATRQAVALAEKYRKRLHICHLTTEEETLYLADHKQEGLITCEATPQHLLLSSPGVYDAWGTLAKINPPIRSSRHRDALWRALQLGIIDFIATDHAPHTLEEKLQPYSKAHSGMPIVELSLPLMLTQYTQKRCRLTDIVRWMCEKPADIFGIRGKGHLDVGYDADLVLVDLKAKKKIINNDLHTRAKWSVFADSTLQGWPVMSFVNGQMVFREGDFFDEIKGKELDITK